MKSDSKFAVLPRMVVTPSCSEQPKQQPPDESVLQFEAVGTSRAARGERLGKVLGCTGCHGKDLTGHPWIEDPDLAILFTSNLTRAVPRYSDAELARTIRSGERPDGSPLWEMPSDIFTALSDPDVAALIAWLRTVKPAGKDHPRIVIGPGGRRKAGEVRPAPATVRINRTKGPAALDGRHDWARYMIRATCTECHRIELKGDQDPTDGPGSPDLIIAGGYSRDEFRHLLRTGEPTDAIYDYLKARAERPQ